MDSVRGNIGGPNCLHKSEDSHEQSVAADGERVDDWGSRSQTMTSADPGSKLTEDLLLRRVGVDVRLVDVDWWVERRQLAQSVGFKA